MSDGQKDIPLQVGEDQAVEGETENMDLTFLEMDQSGAVDLDALFDALNIAAVDGSAAVEFVPGDADGGGTLTIAGSDLILDSVAPEDLPDATDLLVKSSIVSDES